ncbi:MAG TPA: hypothetical protein VKU83_05575 [Puia sp.]|nr:hypothetical protein [Puia sp.]
MQPAIHHLFQVSSIDGVTREQLEGMIEEYPCFGYGHFLLSRKLKATNSDQFLASAQRASLYFPNPFWLQWMLDYEPDATPPRTMPGRVTTGSPASPEPVETTGSAGQIIDESAAELLMDSMEKAKELRESLQKINEDFVARTGHPIPVRETGPEPAFQPEPVREEWLEPAPEPAPESVPVTQDQPIRDEELPFVLDEREQASGAIPPVAEEPVRPAPSSPGETDTLFEPLHTIDYFASQGIRLTLEENPTDQLGRQLKSFTEWLRVMRRLPQREKEIIPDRVAEQAVQDFAAHSIEGKEPVTETMAEVLLKQGMPERARLVYEKLSLLNPDKSAYFAAKIEQLNSH